ncbi:MAG TPA: NifB/NifX family molybdenum-iron cluster-binding protein [Desulfomonilia bacterium]|jgi:predicted Fe-Mo cluster-binding NifX family protein
MIIKAAFTVWNGRIAPVFDVAQTVLIISAENGRIIDQKTEDIRLVQVNERAQWLKDLSLSALICGAISRSLEKAIESLGIKVIGFVSGDSSEVIEAWLGNENLHEQFVMPGCMCRYRNRQRTRGSGGRMRRCRMD